MVRSMLFCGCVAIGVTLFLLGCPSTSFPAPPFNTTGVYDGTWSGTSSDNAQDVAQCPLSLTLTQNLSAGYPGDHAVSGTATIDYSCITLPDWVDTPPPSTVQVSGVLGDDGKLTLISGGCTTALCVVLSLQGTGVDNGPNGSMDMYSGTWSYSILVAGVQPFGFTGTFSVTRTP